MSLAQTKVEEAERSAAAQQKAIADSIQRQLDAFLATMDAEQKREEKRIEQRTNSQAASLAQRERQQEAAEELRVTASEEQARASAEAAASQAAYKAQEAAQLSEKHRLDAEMLSATKKEQKAKDALLKAQRAEEAAKNDKEISFAQAGTQKATKTLEAAEKEKKRVAASLETLGADLQKKKQASIDADNALVQAQDTLKMSENRVHNWDSLVKKAKTNAAKEMADYDEAQENR